MSLRLSAFAAVCLLLAGCGGATSAASAPPAATPSISPSASASVAPVVTATPMAAAAPTAAATRADAATPGARADIASPEATPQQVAAFSRGYLERLYEGLHQGRSAGLLDDADPVTCIGCVRLVEIAQELDARHARTDKLPMRVLTTTVVERRPEPELMAVRHDIEQSDYTVVDAQGRQIASRRSRACHLQMLITVRTTPRLRVVSMERMREDCHVRTS